MIEDGNNTSTAYPTRGMDGYKYCPMQFKPFFHIGGMILAVMILCANSVTIVHFIKYACLRRRLANHILLSLSISDICSAFCIVIHNYPFFYLYFNGCEKLIAGLPMIYFAFTSMVVEFIQISSILHLVVLSTERFIAIYYALTCTKIITKKRVWRAILLTWFFSLFISLVKLIWYMRFISNQNHREFGNFERYYLITVTTTLIGFPTTILFFQYIYLVVIAEKLRQRTSRVLSKKSKRERKVSLMCCLMFACFVIFAYPYILIRLLTVCNPASLESLPAVFMEMAFLLRFIVSLVNPLIYSFERRKLWSSVKKVSRKFSRMTISFLETKSEYHV